MNSNDNNSNEFHSGKGDPNGLAEDSRLTPERREALSRRLTAPLRRTPFGDHILHGLPDDLVMVLFTDNTGHYVPERLNRAKLPWQVYADQVFEAIHGGVIAVHVIGLKTGQWACIWGQDLAPRPIDDMKHMEAGNAPARPQDAARSTSIPRLG